MNYVNKKNPRIAPNDDKIVYIHSCLPFTFLWVLYDSDMNFIEN
jgi:hypothetical protein